MDGWMDASLFGTHGLNLLLFPWCLMCPECCFWETWVFLLHQVFALQLTSSTGGAFWLLQFRWQRKLLWIWCELHFPEIELNSELTGLSADINTTPASKVYMLVNVFSVISQRQIVPSAVIKDIEYPNLPCLVSDTHTVGTLLYFLRSPP